MQRILTLALVLAAFTLATTLALAASGAKKDAKKPQPLLGEIVKLDGTNVIVKNAAGTEITVATDAATVVKINDQPAKLDDLKDKTGQKLRITPATGTAELIEVGAWPKAAKDGKKRAR